MFGNEDLMLLVECAKRALEAEDRYLRQCVNTREWKARPDGISDNINERYYQFVIWRELMACFPWRPRTEVRGYDLAFYDDATGKPVAFAEIKGWWSYSGQVELPGMRRELREKLGILSVPGVMLVLTSQPAERADENFSWLADELGVNRDEMFTASFPTSRWPGDDQDREFAVIGFLATEKALAAAV